MDRLIVEGGVPLSGEITPAGNKNSAQPMLAACLLTEEQVTLHNVPDIADVRVLLQLLRDMGVEVEVGELSSTHTVHLQARNLNKQPDHALGAMVRGSLLMAGPLLTRSRHATVGEPGGDTIGRRRIDTHVTALRALGATVDIRGGRYIMDAPGRLRGADIFLDEASVTGTEQAVLAAVLAEGETTIC